MKGNRKAAEELCLQFMADIVPDGSQVTIYKELFASMTDAQFDKFIQELESGETKLSVIVPNFSKVTPTTENNLKIAKKLGHNFFTHLEIEGKGDVPSHITPIPYLVVDLPMRRASQLIIKKASIPKNQDVIDALTGQPTGESKGAKISYPELQLCVAMNLDASMVELMKYRGGDLKGRAAYIGILNKYGSVTQGQLKNYASGVVSTQTLKTMLTCIHLRNTL